MRSNKIFHIGILDFFKERIGFILLVLLLSVIGVFAVRPDFYMIGWDNYSSYLGGSESIFRTIFSTWRAYRGLGVPGDSESTDVVRQIVLLALSPFVAEPLRDQLYIIGSLWLGVFAIYLLADRLFRRYIHGERQLADIPAALVGIAYLCNLNTLATFYFPIITYITRFASLPLLLLAFDFVQHAKRRVRAVWALFILICLFSWGSFITGTVFITTAVLLGAYALSQVDIRKSIVTLMLFVGMNAFWLVPFVNYTIQKSPALRLAPIFIDVNETQLNQAPKAFSLWHQLILYPNFFDTKITEISGGHAQRYFHPVTSHINEPLFRVVLGLVPIIGLIGMLVLVLQFRQFRRLLWIPVVYGFFLMLSMQEFSPLGFIPSFLNRYIPYFQVIFRFGDTKFHPYMALTQSLAFGFALALGARHLKHETREVVGALSVVVIAVFALLPLSTVYKEYVHGNVLPSFLFVQIPNEYREVAKVVNADSGQGRLLHLPYDPDLYWRSHDWGYMGSAFLQYLLHVPYIDKTFEPASLELSDFYRRLTAIIQDSAQTADMAKLRAQKFSTLLYESGVQWILFDPTVTTDVRMRNIIYWGKYNTQDVEMILKQLSLDGVIEPVSLQESKLTLYKVKSVGTPIEFLSSGSLVDSQLQRVFGENLSTNYLQDPQKKDSYIYPLLYKDAVIKNEKDRMVLEHSISSQLRGQQMRIETSSEDRVGTAAQVTVKKAGSNIVIRVYALPHPDINGKTERKIWFTQEIPLSRLTGIEKAYVSANQYRSNWHVLGAQDYSDIRIVLDGVVLPVLPVVGNDEKVVGNTLVVGAEPSLAVYKHASRISIGPDAFHITENPNCFNDQLDGYTQSYTVNDAAGILSSTNGSSCLVYALPIVSQNASGVVEFGLDYIAETDGKSAEGIPETVTAKPQVAKYISALPKPNVLSVCIQDASFDTCANLHQTIALDKSGTMIVPSERTLYKGSSPIVRLALTPIGRQSQTLQIRGGFVDTYTQVVNEKMTSNIPEDSNMMQLEDAKLSISIPKLLSKGSYFGDGISDAYYATNQPCQEMGAYRTVRQSKQGVISYLSNCYQELSVQMPFDSRIPKLWSVAYTVYSGKYPKFILKDTFAHYSDEYLSLYQGYPTVQGMQSLAQPQQWYRLYGSSELSTIFGRSPREAYTWVQPQADLSDTNNKFYTLHQNSLNEGIFGLSGVSIAELPSSWKDMRLVVGNPTLGQYNVSGKYSVEDMLPSLVKIRMNEPVEPAGQRMLMQRTAYDYQWRAYTSIWNAVLGIGGVVPVRCNGYANCYNVPASSQYYLLYIPERLTLIGWAIVVSIIALCLRAKR